MLFSVPTWFYVLICSVLTLYTDIHTHTLTHICLPAGIENQQHWIICAASTPLLAHSRTWVGSQEASMERSSLGELREGGEGAISSLADSILQGRSRHHGAGSPAARPGLQVPLNIRQVMSLAPVPEVANSWAIALLMMHTFTFCFHPWFLVRQLVLNFRHCNENLQKWKWPAFLHHVWAIFKETEYSTLETDCSLLWLFPYS